MVIIVMIFAIIFAVVLVVRIRGTERSVREEWLIAADALGLNYRDGSIKQISGSYQGFRVEVRRDWVGGRSDASGILTRFTISYPRSLGLGLSIATQDSIVHGLAKLLGAQDVEIGDDDFDKRFVIKGADEEAVRRFLGPMRRMHVERLFSTIPATYIDDVQVISIVFSECDAEYIVSTVPEIVGLARSFVEEEFDELL